MKYKLNLLILYYLYNWITIIKSIGSISLISNNSSIYIYQSNKYNDLFIQSDSEYSCSLNSFYTYKQSNSQLVNNSPYDLNISGISQQINITISSVYGIISPSISSSICNNNNINNNSSCIIQIYNNCPNPVGYLSYFDIIIIKISSLQAIRYYVLCDTSFSTDTFQASQFIILILCIITITLTAIYSRAWACPYKGIQINYYYIVIYDMVIAIGGLLILFASQVAQIIAIIFVWIIGLMSFVICVNQLIFKLSIQKLMRTLIYLKSFPIRIIDFMSFVIGLGFMFGWMFSKYNWVMSNIISFVIIISTIKLFKITSLKKGLVFYITMQIIQIIYLILIDVLQRSSYQQYLINNFNNPFQIQIPNINPIYGLKCSWISISSIIYPGILISYFRRFDSSRNTHIYLITSVILFSFGSFLWILISVISPVNISFGIIAQPAMLGLVSLFAYNRKQIKILWNGKFYDIQFKNQEELDENVQMETGLDNQMKKELFDGIRINNNNLDESQLEYSSERNHQRYNQNNQNNQIKHYKQNNYNDNYNQNKVIRQIQLTTIITQHQHQHQQKQNKNENVINKSYQ